MSSKKERNSRAKVDRQEEEPDPGEPQSESATRAAEVSATTEDVIDEIDDLLDEVDQSLIAMLFKPGEEVNPFELEKRAETMVAQYQQKGGQ